MPRNTTASIIISSLAHRLIAEMSVGLNAVAVQKASGATGHQRSPGAAALSGATGGWAAGFQPDSMPHRDLPGEAINPARPGLGADFP